MSFVGSALFCTDCGCLLDLSTEVYIVCRQCNARYPTADMQDIRIVTMSRPNTGSLLSQQRPVDNLLESATINETCPMCEHKKMRFHTLQMRSADEGATVFYECLNCGHRYSTNQ